MDTIINSFYRSVETKCSIFDSEEGMSVMAFNSPDSLTFCEVRFDNHTDYYLMPFIDGLPVQEKPETICKGIFTRGFACHNQDEFNNIQNAFITFCIESPETETSLEFEDWLSVEGENYRTNCSCFLVTETLRNVMDGYVEEADRTTFSDYYESYKERFNIA